LLLHVGTSDLGVYGYNILRDKELSVSLCDFRAASFDIPILLKQLKTKGRDVISSFYDYLGN
jgi:hypothetical protein